MIRDGKRLAQYGDKQLAQLVASCVSMGIDVEEMERAAVSYRSLCRCRVMVAKAAAAFDGLQHLKTTTEVIPPSPESLAWSSLEGGHRFIIRPALNVDALICGYLDRAVRDTNTVSEAL